MVDEGGSSRAWLGGQVDEYLAEKERKGKRRTEGGAFGETVGEGGGSCFPGSCARVFRVSAGQWSGKRNALEDEDGRI